MRPKGFSISIDTRFYPQGIAEMFYSVVFAIVNKNASLVSFLTRSVLETETNFDSALDSLSNNPIIADVYYILGGTSKGQGALISRNRNNATDVWILDPPTRWFEVETNYDHWTQPPWYDDRVVPADNAINSLGRDNISLDSLFKKVLSIKPVLNIETTFTMLACAADGTYVSYTRYCDYPCVE